MNFSGVRYRRRFQLPVRGEGKLKTYESCEDVRAWSHDMRTRDSYLREWIKNDMPLCVVPVSTLLCFFRSMTCKRRGKAAPRCHANCKSKVILDSITHTCDAVKECLKADDNLDKFFIEEELETSHWPCERCLDALKGIKMFWKIMLEKVFALNLKKNECYYDEKACCTSESVRDVAKSWERDMVRQTVYVKRVHPEPLSGKRHRHHCQKGVMKRNATCYRLQTKYSDSDGKPLSRKVSNVRINVHRCDNRKLSLECSSHTNLLEVERKPSRKALSTKPTVPTADVGCDICCIDKCDISTCKADFVNLQKTYDIQKRQIENLRKENNALKNKLQTLQTNSTLKSFYCLRSSEKDNSALIPKPFESIIEDDSSTKSTAKDAESELIITMKNCKNEQFRHVSLLQVLHKTNEPFPHEIFDPPINKREDPIRILTKVQTALGQMVRREMAMAECKKRNSSSFEKNPSNSEIKASFHRIQMCNISPSHSTISSTGSTFV